MSRTRGHVIAKTDDKFIKYYLAYNSNPEWMLTVLAIEPSASASRLSWCRTGISQFDERGYPHEYHDHAHLDAQAHLNEEFDSLKAALGSCVLENIYVWDGVSWSHKTIEGVVSPERLSEIRPLKRKRNVWRDMRKAHEAPESEELQPE